MDRPISSSSFSYSTTTAASSLALSYTLTPPLNTLPFEQKKKGQYFQPKSLCCLALDNPIRQQCIRVVRNPWFDRIVVLAILLNCIVLSFNDPLDKDVQCPPLKHTHHTRPRQRTHLTRRHHHHHHQNLYWRNKFVEKSDIWFTIAFTIEMVLKIIAMGFIGKGSYLADRWNWLDFIVVVIGYVSKLPKVDNLSALRTFRVLRPLRTLSAIPRTSLASPLVVRPPPRMLANPPVVTLACLDRNGGHCKVHAGLYPSPLQCLPALRLYLLHIWHHWAAALDWCPAWTLRIHQPRQ